MPAASNAPSPLFEFALSAPLLAGRPWVIVRNALVSHGVDPVPNPTRVDFAFLHPARGIALLDLTPRLTPGAADLLYEALLMARLPTIYPGSLPVVYAQVTPAHLGDLSATLGAAFAGHPAPAPSGDPAWVNLAVRVMGGDRVIPVAPPPMAQPPSTQPKTRRIGPMRLAGYAAAAVAAAGGAATLTSRQQAAPAPATPVPVPAVPSLPPQPAAPPAAATAAPASPPPARPHSEPTALLRRAADLMALHDISGARRFYEMAAGQGSVLGAFAMAETYDPAALKRIDPASTVAPNAAAARMWYDKARALNPDVAALLLRNQAAAAP